MRSGEVILVALTGLAVAEGAVGLVSWRTGWMPTWLRGRQTPEAYGLTLALIAGFLLLNLLARLLKAPPPIVMVSSMVALLPMAATVWVMLTGRRRAAFRAGGGTRPDRSWLRGPAHD